MRDRDAYMTAHLGGLTQIYPLAADNPRQIIYEILINLEAELSGAVIKNQKKAEKPQSETIIRRNT